MKVLLDCSLLKIGGALQVGISILEEASKTPGIEWHVICSKKLESQLPSSIKKNFTTFEVINLSIFSKLLPSPIYSSIETRINPDVVFSVFGPAYWKAKAPHLQGFAIPGLIYPKLKMPQSRNFKNYLYSKLINLIKELKLKKIKYFVVETNTVKERLRQNFGIKSENIYVVPNSYSATFARNLREKKRKQKTKKFKIFVPSSYYLHKNLEIIPEVAIELKRITQIPFEFILTLPKNEVGWKKIMELSNKLKVNSYIRTLGAVPHIDIAQTYRNSNVVFLPTMLECSTAVYPESFMAGLPVVTSNLDFAKELCRNAALYFDPSSPSDAANKLYSLMKWPKKITRLVKNGRFVLKKNYPTPKEKWSKYLFCLFDIYARKKVQC